MKLKQVKIKNLSFQMEKIQVLGVKEIIMAMILQ